MLYLVDRSSPAVQPDSGSSSNSLCPDSYSGKLVPIIIHNYAVQLKLVSCQDYSRVWNLSARLKPESFKNYFFNAVRVITGSILTVIHSIGFVRDQSVV